MRICLHLSFQTSWQGGLFSLTGASSRFILIGRKIDKNQWNQPTNVRILFCFSYFHRYGVIIVGNPKILSRVSITVLSQLSVVSKKFFKNMLSTYMDILCFSKRSLVYIYCIPGFLHLSHFHNSRIFFFLEY